MRPKPPSSPCQTGTRSLPIFRTGRSRPAKTAHGLCRLFVKVSSHQDSQYGQPSGFYQQVPAKIKWFLQSQWRSLQPFSISLGNPEPCVRERHMWKFLSPNCPRGPVCWEDKQLREMNQPHPLSWNIFNLCTSSQTLYFWLHFDAAHGGFWDLSSLTRHQTCTLCTGRQIPNHWTAKVVPSPVYFQSSPDYLW